MDSLSRKYVYIMVHYRVLQIYSTAQLHSNIHTHPACILDASRKKGHGSYASLALVLLQSLHLHGCVLCMFQTRLVHVPDASCAHSRRVLCRLRTHLVHVSDASCARSGHVLCTFRAQLVHVPDACRAHPKRLLHAFQMHLTHVPHACKSYLGAELYHRVIPDLTLVTFMSILISAGRYQYFSRRYIVSCFLTILLNIPIF